MSIKLRKYEPQNFDESASSLWNIVLKEERKRIKKEKKKEKKKSKLRKRLEKDWYIVWMAE